MAAGDKTLARGHANGGLAVGIGKDLGFCCELVEIRRMHGFIAHITYGSACWLSVKIHTMFSYIFHRGINFLLTLLCPNKGPVP